MKTKIVALFVSLLVAGCGGGDKTEEQIPTNTAPVANAGSLQNVMVGALVTLDGTASNDANGDALSYAWTLTSKPATSGATLQDSTTAKAKFTADQAGTYSVTLAVYDGKVWSATAVAAVTAARANAAPVAMSGLAQNVAAGTVVTLDGSASSDANGDSLTYSWTLTDRPVGSAAALALATSARPTFTADIAGTYVASLTVNDGAVNSVPSTVTVTVTAAVANAAPVANAGNPQSVSTGAVVTLDGSASSDANGDLLKYTWSLTSKPAGSAAAIASTTSVRPTFTADIAGAYVASLTVNDGKVSSTAATVTVTAAVANAAPVANAGTAQNVSTGSVVTLNGSASSDANGDLLIYTWVWTSKPRGSAAVLASATSSAPSFTADLAGTYVASLTVNDGKVSSGASIVTVTASVANSAPVANAGSAQSVVAGANITLDGSLSSDANGDALNFSWTLVSRPAGSGAVLSSSGSSRPTFVADLAGNYIVQLTVSDGQATSEIVSVTVTASTLNAAPVANAGNAQTVVAGSIVTIDGSRSSDANGDSLSYSWTLTSRPIGSAASLTSPTTVRPTFTADFAGTYVVSLTVSDGRLTSTASVATVTANIVNLGTLQYLGMNSSVENTNSDVVFHGDRAPTISSVSLAGRSCARDPARSSSTVAIFVCVTPAVTSGDERIDYLVVRSSDQPAAWNAGPIYTSSTVFWRNTNGELYLDSLGGYVYLGQGSSGAQIAFMPKSLSGNFGDINFPQLYSALRLGATICPKVVGVDWRYECPILPTGVYSVDLLFDNNSRYIVSQRYAVYISTVGTPTIPTVVNGLCGTNNGRAFSVLPTSAANLCASGGASAVSGNGPWSWTCIGSGLGASNSNCAAAYAPLTPGV